jgi:hypothetical protein
MSYWIVIYCHSIACNSWPVFLSGICFSSAVTLGEGAIGWLRRDDSARF